MVFHSLTEFLLALYRTRLFNPEEIRNVHAMQDQYQVQPLSQYLGTQPPQRAPSILNIKPIDVRQQGESLEFFTILNAMLFSLIKDETGGFTLYLQHDSPGKDLEPNQLPVSRYALSNPQEWDSDPFLFLVVHNHSCKAIR